MWTKFLHVTSVHQVCFCWGYNTWVTVDVHFWRAGGWSGKNTLLQCFSSCGVLGLFNAGTFCLPYLLPECELNREDLEQQSKDALTLIAFSSHSICWAYICAQKCETQEYPIYYFKVYLYFLFAVTLVTNSSSRAVSCWFELLFFLAVQ